MQREELQKSRQARIDSLLSTAAFARVKSEADVSTYYFADSVSNSSDNLRQDRTALGDALANLEKREMSAPADMWLVLTDGKSNSGRNASEVARTLKTPVTAVNVAAEQGAFDVAVVNVDVNPVLFVGQPTDIKVKVGWHGGAGKTISVTANESRRAIGQQPFSIAQDDGFGDVTIKYIPADPGPKMLTITVPPQEGEETNGNNTRTVAVKVLKSRLAILLVADHPDYETGFLSRFLRQADKYDLTFIATGSKAGNLGGRLPGNQSEMNRYDLIILQDPREQMLEESYDLLNSYLGEKGGALWVMYGQQFASGSPVKRAGQLLPFYPSMKRNLDYVEFHAEPTESNLFHPTIRLADDRLQIRDVWANLPPFKAIVKSDFTDPRAVVLAYATGGGMDNQKIPLIGYKRVGPGKVIAMAATPYWTWGFATLGLGEDPSNYEKFVSGTVSWLTVQDDFDPIRITPVKEVFSRGEEVHFDGAAYDQGFRPIPGVTGSVKLESSGAGETQSYEVDLNEQAEGKFGADFLNVAPGEYAYTGVFMKNGQMLAKKEGKILVEAFSLEEIDQGGDPATLMSVARQTGGAYYPFAQFDQAVAGLNLAPMEESVKGELALWGRAWLLLLFIGCLSAEWVIRKANQLL